MSLKSDIYTMLRSFAHHQNNALIQYSEFCDYMKRYAHHHIEEKPQLLPYMNNPQAAMANDIAQLSAENKLIITDVNTDKETIFVISFYTDKYTNIYRIMQNKPNILYPVLDDLPKNTPPETVEQKQASSFLLERLEQENTPKKVEQNSQNKPNNHSLYGLSLPREMPIILLPATVPVNTLLDIAIAKIRIMLDKDEYHDYFLKKLKISNPGKELSVKNFFNQVIQRPTETLESIKTSSETFYFWSQLCYFIRQDYEKVKDYTVEDLSVLQSVYLTEICIGFFKSKIQQNNLRTNAFLEFSKNINKPPYFYSTDGILQFVDKNGKLLLGQYTREELNSFLTKKLTTEKSDMLPELFTFTIEAGTRYYICKTKVFQLIIRLCNDSRETIKDNFTKEWTKKLREFSTEPEMKDQIAFEKRLINDVKTYSPVLYAILNAKFLSPLQYENTNKNNTHKITLFSNEKLRPYSELLMLSRHEILTDVKIMLPFWYTTPIISWFARLFLGGSAKNKSQKSSYVTLQSDEDILKPKNSRKTDLKHAANKLAEQMIEPNSTLDRELASYENEWNTLIGKKLRDNLTEDVNSLVRDYLRKIIRTMQGSSFTKDRIENLTETLISSPGLKKIHNKDALSMYIQLYIIKIIQNTK